MHLKEGITHMQSQMRICANCVSSKTVCIDSGSVYYELEVAPNSTCPEFEINMKFES